MGLMAKRLARPVIGETSGVDHPAHEAPGWLVMKSAGDPAPGLEEILKAAGLDAGYYNDDDEGEDDVADAALAKQVEDLTAALAVEKAAREAVEKAVVA